MEDADARNLAETFSVFRVLLYSLSTLETKLGRWYRTARKQAAVS